jgi:hypothetical protein
MGKKIIKSFIIPGDIDTLFEQVKRYLPTQNYSISTVERPRLIVARRGSTLGSYTSFHIQKWITVLTVYFSPVQEGIQVLCDYDIFLPISGILTAKDVGYLDTEFDRFREFLVSQLKGEEEQADKPMTGGRKPDKDTKHPSAMPGYMVELQYLAQLRDKGVITEEEFNIKKRQLLEIQ